MSPPNEQIKVLQSVLKSHYFGPRVFCIFNPKVESIMIEEMTREIRDQVKAAGYTQKQVARLGQYIYELRLERGYPNNPNFKFKRTIGARMQKQLDFITNLQYKLLDEWGVQVSIQVDDGDRTDYRWIAPTDKDPFYDQLEYKTGDVLVMYVGCL